MYSVRYGKILEIGHILDNPLITVYQRERKYLFVAAAALLYALAAK